MRARLAAKSKRAAVSFQTAVGRARVTSTFALRFSSFSRRSSPRSGALPHFARKRSAALATSRLRAENASSKPLRHAGDLEVAALLAGPRLDRIAALLRAGARARER